jgi:hypothetical protein
LRARLALAERFGPIVCLALFAAAPGTAGEMPPPTRLGLATAYYEHPNGGIAQVPGPTLEIDGQPWVPAVRRRGFLAVQHLHGGHDSKQPGGGQATPSLGQRRDVAVNDPTGEWYGNGNTQNDPSVAVSGDTLVCVFTDSEGGYQAGSSNVGYASSLDAGATWTDAGTLPLAGVGGSEMLLGKPILCTDHAGRWYAVSLYDVGTGTSGPGSGDYGLALSTGTFAGGVLSWSAPVLIAGGLVPGAALDFHHAIVDPRNDRLYVTYTNFSPPLAGWGQVEVVTLGEHGTQPLHALVLQVEIDQYNNGGSRLGLGPNGELFCTWEAGALSGIGQGPAEQKVARSLDLGATFEPAVTAATVIESWFSNPPGSTREDFHPEFPAIAVDTLPGPNQGRVYLTWHDAVQMNFNFPATGITESAAWNNTPQTAQVLPDSANLYLDGSLPYGDSVDYYRMHGQAGEHFRAYVEPSGYLWPRLQVWCTDSAGTPVDTLLSSATVGIQEPAYALFTLPYTGDYTLAIHRVALSGDYRAWIRRTTSTLPSTATDFRDVVVVSSPDGIGSWSAKVRVNDDVTYGGQAWPEVAVDENGLHVSWYDWRNEMRSHVLSDAYAASSLDAGATFQPNVRLTGVSSFWQVSSDGFPNFGDAIHPAAANGWFCVPWTDSRTGDPDVRMSVLATEFRFEAPDTVRVNVGNALNLELDVENGAVHGDTITLVVQSSCGGLVPQGNLVLAGLASFEVRSAVYALGSAEQTSTRPCMLHVDAMSARTGRQQEADVVVWVDGTVDVTVQDFRSQFTDGAIELRWTSAAGARFRVQRGPDRQGPFANGPEPVEVAPGSFFARDSGLQPGAVVFYLLLASAPDRTWQVAATFEVVAAVPRAVTFAGARPNPFNPETTLHFELPRAAPVRLSVLDVRGRRVAELLAGARREPGAHAVRWDGRDALGRGVASGVYVAELVVDAQRYVCRVVVVR